ncbi:MAG TPA: hypothetical protein VGM89_19140, partial [Puia sp.]
MIPVTLNTEKTREDLEAQTEYFRGEVRKRSDKLMNYFLIGFFLVGLILARYFDTWGIALSIGGVSVVAYYSTKWLLPHSDLYQYV